MRPARYFYRARDGSGGPGGGEPLASYRALFRQPSFPAFFWAGALQFAAPASVLVVLLFSIAFAYPADQRTTFGALALAFLGLSSALPTLGSAFFSGALADRYDRADLMRGVNVLALLATAAIAVVLVYAPGTRVPLPGPAGFYLPLWVLLLYPGWAAVTVSSTLFRPAFNPSVSRVVPPELLATANGTIYAVAGVVAAAATLAVGVLLTVAPVVWALTIPFALFFLTQIALSVLRADLTVRRSAPSHSLLADAREGFAYLAERREILEITIAALVLNFFSAVALVELALYAASWLDLAQGYWYGALVATMTIGSSVGLVLIPKIRFEHRAGRVLLLLMLVMGLALVALALVRSVWFALPIVFVYGMVPGMFMTVFLTTVQATVPDEKMGRVFSADEVGSYALVPVGQYAGGLLTVAIGVQGTYLASGVAIALFGVMAAASFRALRGLKYRTAAPVEPTEGAAPA
ncbi:MAG TPA: MFS transporter [Thermoplasmata archaeon]|nr:MFS transporter [Thermoplasmata archaeon]